MEVNIQSMVLETMFQGYFEEIGCCYYWGVDALVEIY